MTTTKISERREVLEYDGDDRTIAYIGMWVDGVQIAAAVRQDDDYADRNRGARWSLWSSALTLDVASPLPALTAEHARAWLNLIADLAERGPQAANRHAQPAAAPVAEDCEHDDWVMVESGYERQWSIDIDDDDKVIKAFYGGSEDFSEEGAGDERLRCSICLAERPLPAGYEVDYE